jgi:uncharacterized protein DUF6461
MVTAAADLTASLSGARTPGGRMTTSRDIARAQAVLTKSPGLAEALCITAVDADANDAVTRYGGFELDDPLTLEEALTLETMAYPRRLDLAVVIARPAWTFMVEPSGTHGTRPETLRRLSDGATAVNVFWNINLHTRCRYWENQMEQVSFELLDDEPHPLADPRLQRLRQGLTFDDERFMGEALVLLERITGVRVDWMTERHPAAVVVAFDRFATSDAMSLLSDRAPDLGDAHPTHLESFAARAVDAACRIVGVEQHMLIQQPDALITRARELVGQHVMALIRTLRTEGVAPDHQLHQASAIAAIHARLADDLTERTAGALVHAINAVPGGWPRLKQQLDDV